jgi:hypothetical protein
MHHAAGPSALVLVARRLDATAARDLGRLVVWQARAALVAARCAGARLKCCRSPFEALAKNGGTLTSATCLSR